MNSDVRWRQKLSLNSPYSQSQSGHCEKSTEVLQNLSGPGDLHGHLSLPHLVLHQDLTLHLYQRNRF